MTSAGSAREARSDQSTRLWQLQHGRAKCQVRRRCGLQQSLGQGSKGRVAGPSFCRMRTIPGARQLGRPGGRGECGRPLQRDCE
jgi:hypothetical protein